jgi:hypothetical protein
MQRIDEAISCYHQALAIQPKFAFCSEMVNRAMEDMINYRKDDFTSWSSLESAAEYKRIDINQFPLSYVVHDNISQFIPSVEKESFHLRGENEVFNDDEIFSPDISLTSSVNSYSRVVGRLSL